jgi:hypothetical protein
MPEISIKRFVVCRSWYVVGLANLQGLNHEVNSCSFPDFESESCSEAGN